MELTDFVIFSEPDQSEADGYHTRVAEERDGIVRRLELRSGIWWKAGAHVRCYRDGAEWVATVYRHRGLMVRCIGDEVDVWRVEAYGSGGGVDCEVIDIGDAYTMDACSIDHLTHRLKVGKSVFFYYST